MKKTTLSNTPQKTSAPSHLGENTKLTFNIPWKAIDESYQKSLKKASLIAKIPGFRVGKAPLPLVEQSVGKDSLLDDALQQIVPFYYQESVQKEGILPLTQPQISIRESQIGQEWILDAETAVAPQVELRDYRAIAKEALRTYQESTKIQSKVADKSTELTPEEIKKNERENKLHAVFTALIEKIDPKIAPLLLHDEMNRQLEQLLHELEHHNITLKDYIDSAKKTTEEFNQELAISSLAALQLEFILQAITKDLNFKSNESDMQTALGLIDGQKIPELDPRIRTQLESTILRKKTVEFLLELSNTTTA